MSELDTVLSIFLEPGKTFEALRDKPYVILGTIILAILTFGFSIGVLYKFGDDRYRWFFEELNSKQESYQTLTEEQKEDTINTQLATTKFFSYASWLFIIIYLAFGGLITLAICKAFGYDLSYKQAYSLWLYSVLPASVIFTVANLIVLYLKPVDEIDILMTRTGFLPTNPGLLVDMKKHPVMATFLSSFDLFRLWSWGLFAIGLQKLARFSTSMAYIVTIGLFLLILIVSVLLVFLSPTQ